MSDRAKKGRINAPPVRIRGLTLNPWQKNSSKSFLMDNYYELREIGIPNLGEALSEFGKVHDLLMR